MNWIVILFAVVANAAASGFLKWASPRVGEPFTIAIALSPKIWAAIACYGAAFILYAVAVARIPLNVAQPVITAATIVLVGFVSLAFGETLTIWHAIGYGLLVLGIAALSYAGLAHAPQTMGH